jgi:hypothetical protein
VAQGTLLNQAGVGWARRDVDVIPRVLAPKESPSDQGPLSMIPTKSIVCDSAVERVQLNQPRARDQRDWVFYPNKIYQT